MEAVLEVLMRKYPGIFSYPLPIEEDYVAASAGLQVPALRQVLYGLSLQHIIRYIPADHATVIYLHYDRLRPKNVNLDPERYARLKRTAHERMQAMEEYVQEEDECRSRYILRYFGQEKSDDCGTCDVCRSDGAKEHLARLRHESDC
ncbi:MAG: RecQ family zinc-binding domain-containing protein, partial [Bacteroidales bacterium]|nr:RecQ family zinc-binding domain-containing protein [Bacteroidales bacterium]